MDRGLKLYEISDAMGAALDGCMTIDEDTGEILFDPADLDAIEVALADKAEAVVCAGRNLAAMADAIKAEEERLARARKSYERRAEWLKSYAAQCLDRAGVKSIDTGVGKLTVTHSKAVAVLDESAIPDAFTVTPEPPKPRVDKKAVKAAIEAGEEVPGAAVVTNLGLRGWK